MSSEARLAANQANAQLSTGPRTPEGKAASSQNSRKHGFSSRELFIRADERAQFDNFQADLYAELDPQGALESITFSHLLHAAWTLRRLHIEEAKALANSDTHYLDCINRYATRHQRCYHNALEELRKLQTERAFRVATLPRPVRTAVPRLVAVTSLSKRTQREAPELVLAMYNNLLIEAGLPDRAPVAA